MAWETDNTLYGRTNSPWDLERTPGGSTAVARPRRSPQACLPAA